METEQKRRPTPQGIRGLDATLYRRIRDSAYWDRRLVGEILNEAMALWLQRRGEVERRPPFDMGGRAEGE